MQKTTINDKLYEKAAKEYFVFLEELEKKPAKEIIKSSYEKVFKEDILMSFQSNELSEDKAKVLLATDNLLDKVYLAWLDQDVTYMDVLNECINEYAKELMEEKERIVMEYVKRISELQWIGECDMSGDYDVMAVQVEFSHKESELDETELNIDAYNYKELAQLFADFCEENKFTDVEIKGIFIVRVAIDHDELTEIEEGRK